MSSRFMPRQTTRLAVELGDFTLNAEATAGGFVVEAPAEQGENVSGALVVGGQRFSFEGQVSWTEAASQWRAQPRTSVLFTRIENGYFAALCELRPA